jgi:plasmid maintenance system antidote protein VapI
MVERFKKAIKSTGLSHIEIADKLGVKSHDISNMSAKRKTITPEFALLFEKEFFINPCWLFFGRGDMTAKFDLTDNDLNKKIDEISRRLEQIENGTKD